MRNEKIETNIRRHPSLNTYRIYKQSGYMINPFKIAYHMSNSYEEAIKDKLINDAIKEYKHASRSS